MSDLERRQMLAERGEQELLVATAAGYVLTKYEYDDFGGWCWHLAGEPWAPVENSCDALELAVRLRLHVDCQEDYVEVFYRDHNDDLRRVEAAYGEDDAQAVRNAIFCAALEYVGCRP